MTVKDAEGNPTLDELRQLAWLLRDGTDRRREAYAPPYGDVTELNTSRRILNAVGKDTLREIAEDAIDLIDTSVSIYEVNGDYAFGMFSSGWCRIMDMASRQLCGTDDNRKALSCGCWLCHENCWNDSAKAAMAQGGCTDIECVGGIRLYAEPIYAADCVVGVINIGYGDPPKDIKILGRLAERFHIDIEKLEDAARSYQTRPSVIVDSAKKRVRTCARLIGEIVEKAEAERALEASKELLDATGRMARVGGWELDAETMEVTWTKETYRIHEVPMDYKPPLEKAIEFFHPEDRDQLSESIQRALNEGKPYDMEIRFITAKGNDLWTRTMCRPEVVNGKVCKLRGTFQDITKRKHAQLAVQRERQRLAVTLRSIGDGVITTDVDGAVVLINNVAENLTGWKEPEAQGKKLDEIFHIINEKTRERCEHPVEKVLETCGIVGLANDTVLISRDGTERVIADSAAPILDDDGKSVGVVLVFRDITEKIELETELRHAHKMEAIGNLAGGIAHEFNNVLGIIIGNAELAIGDLEKWHPIAENLTEIKLASLRAKDVVKQLLAFSRKMDVKREPVDVRIIVKETLKLLRAAIPATIRIRESIPEQIDAVSADPTQLHQLLINLCNNAAQAMSDDGGTLTVELKNIDLDFTAASKHPDLKPGAYVRFSVSDTGQGIASEMLDKIFDPYFTTKDVGKGTGMGLAVAHGIVKAHNGAIDVKSKMGTGTAFHVYFPASEDKATYRTDNEEKALPQGTERILFVDDEPSIVGLCTKILDRLGYSVTSDTDPNAILERFRKDPGAYDLIVSDMTMPDLTGDQLAREVLKVRPDIPVIICTGFSEKMSAETSKEMGIRAFLMKPIEKAELANRIREVLDNA